MICDVHDNDNDNMTPYHGYFGAMGIILFTHSEIFSPMVSYMKMNLISRNLCTIWILWLAFSVLPVVSFYFQHSLFLLKKWNVCAYFIFSKCQIT